VPQTFRTALRGYDRTQVDRLISLAQAALASGSDSQRASARQALRGVYLRPRLRGYARRPVDRAVHQLMRDLSAEPGSVLEPQRSNSF
jgi:hypothetical protein